MAGKASFGGSVKLSGETEYIRALKNVNDSLKVLGSGLKAAAAQFDENDKSVENLSKQNEILNKSIEEQKKKVETLRKALADAKTETGEDSVTTKKWQYELNNAEADLGKLNRQLRDNEKDLKDAESAADGDKKALKDLGDQSDKTGSKMEALSKGMKAVAASAAAIASAAVAAGAALSKQAITLYADYEQLIGGVETLFDKSSDMVKEYAANAYKTSGLSANEYMETVTGFSASLIQSLGGDTEKAAKKADMAITDMSDNANKMGTDMQAVMSAYSGFSKGQFTLLDNLKLGYGGTKTEMERLLADAQKISGIKYDVNSYADIVDAIHVIQSEMGITGTTAKEASSTISGSLNAMKSSWQNLLVGVADEGQNFDTLIGNMQESVVSFANNIIPRIKTTVSGLGDLVKGLSSELLPMAADLLPELLDELLPSIADTASVLIDSLVSVLPGLLDITINKIIPSLLKTVMSTAKKLISSLISALPGLMKSLTSAMVDLAKEIFSREYIEASGQLALDAVKSIVSGLKDSLPILLDGVFELLGGVVDALPDAIDMILKELPSLIQMVADTLVASLPKLIQGAIKLIDGLVAALPSIITSLIDSLPQIFSSLIDAATTLLPQLVSGAMDLVSSLVLHLPDILTSLIDSIPKMIGMIFDADKGFLSPTNIGKLVSGAAKTVTTLFMRLPEIIFGLIEKIPTIIASLFSTTDGFMSRDNIGKFVSGAISVVGKIVGHLSEIIGGLLKAIPELVVKIVKKVISAVTDYFAYDEEPAQTTVYKNLSSVNSTGKTNDKVIGVIGADGTVIGNDDSVTKKRNRYGVGRDFATGGVVTKPTFGRFGEAGAEAIVPLERNTQWIDRVAEKMYAMYDRVAALNASPAPAALPAAASPQYNIHVAFGDVTLGSDMDIDTVAQQMSQAIAREVLAKGGSWA